MTEQQRIEQALFFFQRAIERFDKLGIDVWKNRILDTFKESENLNTSQQRVDALKHISLSQVTDNFMHNVQEAWQLQVKNTNVNEGVVKTAYQNSLSNVYVELDRLYAENYRFRKALAELDAITDSGV